MALTERAAESGNSPRLTSAGSDEAPNRSRLAVLGRSAVRAAALYLTATILLFSNAWRAPASRWVGFSGDPQLIMWFLGWTQHALAHGDNIFITHAINAPSGVNLAWNTLMPLPGVLLAPVTALWGPVVAYNVLVTVGVAASAWCGYITCRRLTGSEPGALAGGAVYGFSPYMSAHMLGHGALVVVPFVPLILLAMHEALVRQRWPARRAGLALGLLAACQLHTDEEVLAGTAVAAAVFVLVLALLNRHDVLGRAPHALRALAWALATFAPLSAWILLVQFAGPLRVSGLIQPRDFFVTDVLNTVLPTDALTAGPHGTAALFDFTGNAAEWSGYLGVPLLMLIGLVVWRLRRDRRVRTASLCALVLWVLSLGPHLHVAGRVTPLPLPWDLVARLPLAENMLPSRFSLFVDLALAVVVAVGVGRLWSTSVAIHRATLALSAATALTLLPVIPTPAASVPQTDFFGSAAVRALPQNGMVLVLPYTVDFSDSDPMLWQAQAGMWFRMPEGYFVGPGDREGARYGPAPSAILTTLRRVDRDGWAPPRADALRRALLDDLRAWRVEAVVLGPMPHRDQVLSLMAWVLGRAPRDEHGVSLWLRI